MVIFTLLLVFRSPVGPNRSDIRQKFFFGCLVHFNEFSISWIIEKSGGAFVCYLKLNNILVFLLLHSLAIHTLSTHSGGPRCLTKVVVSVG